MSLESFFKKNLYGTSRLSKQDVKPIVYVLFSLSARNLKELRIYKSNYFFPVSCTAQVSAYQVNAPQMYLQDHTTVTSSSERMRWTSFAMSLTCLSSHPKRPRAFSS